MSGAAVIIPARWGSTRFKGKPLHLVAGKPLLRHVWERCQRAKELDAVIIATDDMRIAQAAFDWGAEVALTSSRHRSGTDRVAEVARKARQFDLVINVQGDEPLIEPRLIDRIVKKLRSDHKIDIVTAAHPFADPRDSSSPHQVKVAVDNNGVALDFFREPPSSRTGGLPWRAVAEQKWQTADSNKRRLGSRRSLKVLRHQGIYGFRRRALFRFVTWKQSPRERTESLEQLRALENGVRVHVLLTKHGSPGVDTPADAKAVAASLREAQLKRRKNSRRVARRATAARRISR
jgi:3-deoxy-manno-octulosonate cytidylyltransferase (CMP-KDO synthetase)